MKSLQFELKIDLWSPQKIAGAFTFLIILTQIIVITSKTEPSKFKIISETYNLTAPYPIKLRFEIETLNRLNQFLITTVHFKSDLPIGMVVSPTINVTTYGSDTSNKISTRRSADLEIECQPKGSRTFVKFYLPKLILIFSLWLFLMLDKSSQPQIELYESQKESSKAFFYSYGIIYLIALTWSWGKTRRGLKQKRYLKRFTFFVVTSIPILFLFWLTLAKHIIYNNYDANDRANMEWLVITIYTTYLSYGWLYHKPHELFEYFSSEKFKHGSDNFEFDLDEENEPRKVPARVRKKEKDLGEVDFDNQNMNEKFFDSNTFSLKTEDDLDQKSDCNLEGDNIN
ncbi:transmembrane protein [Anaeramoeba flamelloides]|uniref:Transmembrane protein n=1 Tax=Anaeramoeba flamelloides TaxID=1746091 RepID=A0ABQ8YR96_9EUKA|nr:transmembrane protein [Anaeramoeba flamelloides]